MKKLFSLITVLITLSLAGIIILQISWLRNMVTLREDQVKQRIDGALANVVSELAQFKEQYMMSEINDPSNIFKNIYPHDFLKQNSIVNRLGADQIYNKLRTTFDKAELKDMNFEFAIIAGVDSRTPFIEAQSPNFQAANIDSIANYIPSWYGITTRSATAGEGLTNTEALAFVALGWKKVVLKSLALNIAMAILFTLVILAAFYTTIYTMLRQKKLSDIKNDFINNMTHEFKTPIATISLAVDALKNEKVINDRQKTNYFSGIIKEENQRMNKQVETILKASQFDKQDVELDMKTLHVHDVIEDVVDNFALQLHDKDGDADLKLDATNDMIEGDEVHFTNLINNLIDNAVKYSKENVPIKVKITTGNNNGRIFIKVEDNGIGMSKETQKRVFEKFYRAHTGNLHNVKGFGLGLSYVKSVTQSHHGNVKLESTLGKGTAFTVDFPVANVES